MLYSDLVTIEKSVNSINTLSPYVGKMRQELAKYLIENYAKEAGYIYDPFAGSGTVLLEGWCQGYNVIGTDLNYYAYVLSMGKLHPYSDENTAQQVLSKYKDKAEKKALQYNISDIPVWVKEFFCEETLKEIASWTYYFKKNKEWFLLSCLLGILHHQRPGFLSYPSSHGAPYLRCSKYPKDEFPEMYAYKNVYEKLSAKIHRSYKNTPFFDFSLHREIHNKDTTKIKLQQTYISTIITSPPYMKSLTYARDNRLRLWFLGIDDWTTLDKKISPNKIVFTEMMKKCFKLWGDVQKQGDKCVIVIGDINISYNSANIPLSDLLVNISSPNYKLIEAYQDPIPESKKVVKGNNSIKREIIVVLERV